MGTGVPATVFTKVFQVSHLRHWRQNSPDLSSVAVFSGVSAYNLILGVVVMLPPVIKITKNYLDRKLKNKDVSPVLSYDPEIQAAAEDALQKESV